MQQAVNKFKSSKTECSCINTYAYRFSLSMEYDIGSSVIIDLIFFLNKIYSTSSTCNTYSNSNSNAKIECCIHNTIYTL